MSKKSAWWQIPFLLALIAGTVYVIREANNSPYQRHEGHIFGTTYHITYQSRDNLQAGIIDALQEVDACLSMFNDTSLIARINRGEQPDVAGTMFEEVVSLALDISKETGGAFDITVAPLVNAWGFGFKSGNMPSKEQVDSLMQLVGYQKISLQRSSRPSGRTATVLHKQDPRTMLDCSAIAKGYGCDVVARYLKRHDVNNFMVEIGGEVVAYGVNPDKQPWNIGIQKPVEETPGKPSGQGGIQEIISLSGKALATSGNYRRFYYKDGKKYAHTIDPATGYPVEHSLLSATVVATDCATADAYATALMVMGLERAKAFLERHRQLSAWLIYADADGNYKTLSFPER